MSLINKHVILHLPPLLSSRFLMDLGLATAMEEDALEQPKKRRAVGGTSTELNKHVFTLNKLVMSNSMNARHLQGAVFDTWRLMASSGFVANIKDATRLHTESMKKQCNNEAAANKPGPPHIHAWSAIISTLNKLELTDEEKQHVAQYITLHPQGVEGSAGGGLVLQGSQDLRQGLLQLRPGPDIGDSCLPHEAHPDQVPPQRAPVQVLPRHAAQGALERTCQGWVDNQHL